MRPQRPCLVLFALFCISVTPFAQNAVGTKDEASRSAEQKIKDRDRISNGIAVGTPKVYDDSVLQQMLNAAILRLNSLQIIDQGSILGRLGSLTGANQQISSFGLAVQGPPTPQSVITSNGATKQTVDTVKSPTDSTVATTSTMPVQNTTTTIPQFNVPTATAPVPSTSLPSSFSVSASDILNEQMQLAFEIANLRLLLEGSLNDRIVINDKGKETVRPRSTVGFPIAISPDKRFKDAVAVVEVTVRTGPCADLTGKQEPPAITALLPREKTYNVAAIKDRSVSIGAGVATQIVGISGSFFSGHKTYYIVKDQDTVALTFETPQDDHTTGFLWQFRPVLGQSYVQSGLKQTFVQLAFPSPLLPPHCTKHDPKSQEPKKPCDCPATSAYGTVQVKTYWRKYDRNTGIVKDVIPGSFREINHGIDVEIPAFSMKQNIESFGPTKLEDQGGGQMLVEIDGNFLGGTYVRVGSTLLQPGSPGFTSEYKLIRFIAPITDLATKRAFLVTRDGTEVRLHFNAPFTCQDSGHKKCPLKLKENSVSVTPLDEANSLLTLETDPVVTTNALPLVLVIGGKVFGYSDAPIGREDNETSKTHKLSVVLPTSFLISNPDVIVKPLMSDNQLDPNQVAHVTLFSPNAELERIVLLDQVSGKTRYLLFGRDLANLSVLQPGGTFDPPALSPQPSSSRADQQPDTTTTEPPDAAPRTHTTEVRQSRQERQVKTHAQSSQRNDVSKIELLPLGTEGEKDTLRLLVIDAAFAKTLKQVVFRRKRADGKFERPFVVSVPAPPAADQPKQDPKFQERVTVGADEATIVGDDLAKVTKVVFQGKELDKAMDGKNLKIKGLVAAGVTTAAKTQSIDLVTGSPSKTTIKLEVVNSKIESVAK